MAVTCFALLALAVFAGLAGTAPTAEAVIARADVENTLDRQMGREINRVRAAHGRRRLGRSQRLHRASRRYAGWLASQHRFVHAAPLLPEGFSGAGEVLERHYDGQPRVPETVQLWMRSPSHRKVLLNPKYRVAGASLSRDPRGERPSVWVLRLGYR